MKLFELNMRMGSISEGISLDEEVEDINSDSEEEDDETAENDNSDEG